jgi:hypothetical protein
MYAFIQKSGHVIWKEWWYALMSRVSLQANLYVTQEDQVFIVDVWLVTQRKRQWFCMSLVDLQVQLWNLAPLLKSTSIKHFTKGMTLF